MYIMLKQPLALVALLLLCLCTVGAGAPEIDPAVETMTAEESIQWAVNEYGDNFAMTPSFARQRCPQVVFHFRDCQLQRTRRARDSSSAPLLLAGSRHTLIPFRCRGVVGMSQRRAIRCAHFADALPARGVTASWGGRWTGTGRETVGQQGEKRRDST